MKKILITGSAGFIGMHISKYLSEKDKVLGIDNINNYYDKSLKIARINNLKKKKNFTFVKCDLNQKKKLENLIKKFKPHIVLNLAAQAGVRYSIKNPDAYIKSNILGFQNLIELCAKYKVKNFLYASSSSVYGLNNNKLNQEADDTDQPLSLYAATKKSNENIAHVYSYIYGIKTTGLRFFTVYGPWGRPDMALFKFVQNILRNKKITVFNGGKMKRSFTYIDDVVLSLKKIIFKKNNPNKKLHDVLNIGGDKSVNLDRFILEIERNLNTKAKKIFLPIQMGDVKNTSADTTKLKNYIGYQPKTPINIGIKKFVSWYKNFYRVN
ncbi:MAG: protein CapI [Euryarchaeota archaeon]|nr:protein CapI [Euryarchaeota archaeon]